MDIGSLLYVVLVVLHAVAPFLAWLCFFGLLSAWMRYISINPCCSSSQDAMALARRMMRIFGALFTVLVLFMLLSG